MSRSLARIALVLALAVQGCDDTPAPGAPCEAGATTCFDDPDYLLTCSEAGTWTSQRCPDARVCYQGSCQDLACAPGSKACRAGGVITCRADGSGYGEPEGCSQGFTCDRGACRQALCNPGETRCLGGTSATDTEVCDALGVRWTPGPACPGGTSCLKGTCLPATCEADQKECGPSTVFTCDATGHWRDQACPKDQPCLFGRCVACVNQEGCADDEACRDGACVATTPEISTVELPPATASHAYSARLEAQGGARPYTWTISKGQLPAGLTLATDGTLSGTPGAAGEQTFTVKVTDKKSQADEQQYTLEVAPEGPLKVATTSLPEAEMGLDYTATLSATGGQAPYAWQILKGPLPKGLSLSSTGVLSGIAELNGEFPLTVRVFDSLPDPGYATKDLKLTVKIAPLSIEGEQSYNLLFTKIVVLPTLIQAVPYSADLVAKGGLKPYAWSEQPPPAGLGWIFPKWGLPKGLSVDPKGKVSGWATDVSDAVTVNLALFGLPNMTGYFVYLRVTDHQNPADTDEAVYCLPTVPLQ